MHLEVKMDSAKIQIISNYFENLYCNKMENSEDMNRFLDLCSFLRAHGTFSTINHTAANTASFSQCKVTEIIHTIIAHETRNQWQKTLLTLCTEMEI